MLSNKTISLRAWKEDDIPVLSGLRNDLELQDALMAKARPNTEARVRQWLVEKSGRSDAVFFVIADQSSDSALGFIQTLDIDSLHRTGTLGICIAPGAQGKGIGGAAIALLEVYLVNTFDLRKLTLAVLADNEAAVSLYARLGFSEAGRWTAHYFSDGQFKDVLLMEKHLAL